MADYGTDINVYDYKYRRPVYYTNPLATDREDVIIRMVLKSSNFNFSLARSDLGDFRLAENETGARVLRMWVAYIDTIRPYVSIYFKLPRLLSSETKTLWAFFGNSSVAPVNEPNKIGFVFYETFDSSPLNSSKWAGDIDEPIYSPGYFLYWYADANNGYIITLTNPLQGMSSWIVEAGSTCTPYSRTGTGVNSFSMIFNFTGPGVNGFMLRYCYQTTWQNASNSAFTNYSITGISQGVEANSYQDNLIAYNEQYPRVYQHSYDRNTYADVSNIINRDINGETQLSNIAIYGASTDGASYFTYMNWLVVRPFDVDYRVLIDCSDLYITSSYQLIYQPSFDTKKYGDDITKTIYKHETDFGGDSYLLSDDLTDTVWISDINAVAQPYISSTINFGYGVDLTNSEYTHFDSNHVKFFGAKKLSDENSDVWGRSFWDCPTNTNCWAAIEFEDRPIINYGVITAVNQDLDCCPKNYIFYGSNYNPTTDLSKADTLCSGIFSKVSTPQQFYFNNKANYRYYVLYIIDNYGGSNVRIQEWEMFNLPYVINKKHVSQLRLLPPTEDLLYCFPKEISLQASVDTNNWDTLIPWMYTYSPFIQFYTALGYWQQYSFVDVSEKGYWAYRLLCRGNWGETSGRIAIKEWELYELSKEYDTYRILSGTTNNIKQIWATSNCSIDDNNNLIYATNDKLNYIANNSVYSVDLPPDYNDINIIQGI